MTTRFPEPVDDDRLPVGFVGFLGGALLILLVLVAWLLARVDWLWLLDFLAPTAAQARDLGWVNIVEGL